MENILFKISVTRLVTANFLNSYSLDERKKLVIVIVWKILWKMCLYHVFGNAFIAKYVLVFFFFFTPLMNQKVLLLLYWSRFYFSHLKEDYTYENLCISLLYSKSCMGWRWISLRMEARTYCLPNNIVTVESRLNQQQQLLLYSSCNGIHL